MWSLPGAQVSNELGESMIRMLEATSPPSEDARKLHDEAQAALEQALSLATVQSPLLQASLSPCARPGFIVWLWRPRHQLLFGLA